MISRPYSEPLATVFRFLQFEQRFLVRLGICCWLFWLSRSFIICHKHLLFGSFGVSLSCGVRGRKALFYEDTEKLPFLLKWKFFFYIIFNSFLRKITKKVMIYSIANSFNLTIRFIFATDAVKYICGCMTNKPLESALHKPWASFSSPFFFLSWKYPLLSNLSLSRFFSLACVML